MKINIKSFIAGALFMLLSLAAAMYVYAEVGKGIKSASYNEKTKVVFNGRNLDIRSFPMVEVVKDGENYASNYMPFRSVLSQMGYVVVWDGSEPCAFVMTEAYLKSSEEWVNFAVVLNTINGIGDPARRAYVTEHIAYLDDRKTVHAYFDARHEWDIPTAVVGETVYIRRNDANHFHQLFGLPLILTPNEIAVREAWQKEYTDSPYAFVTIDKVLAAVNYRPTAFSVTHAYDPGLVTDPGVIEFRRSDELLAAVDVLLIEDTAYVRRVDINPHLMKYNFPSV